MARKPSFKEAKAWALRIYRLALAKAEKGDWEGARDLTLASVRDCKFCRIGIWCSDCAALHICNGRPQKNAHSVIEGSRTPANGIRQFRRTIKQLEALEVD